MDLRRRSQRERNDAKGELCVHYLAPPSDFGFGGGSKYAELGVFRRLRKRRTRLYIDRLCASSVVAAFGLLLLARRKSTLSTDCHDSAACSGFVGSRGPQSILDIEMNGRENIYVSAEQKGAHELGSNRHHPSFDNDPIPILIHFPMYGSEKEGGFSRRGELYDPLNHAKMPSFNGLVFNKLEDGIGRQIVKDVVDEANDILQPKHADEHDAWLSKWLLESQLGQYYAMDDDAIRHPTCRRTALAQLHMPNCNLLHQIDIGSNGEEDDNFFFSSGYYRDAWSVLRGSAVLKKLKFSHPYDFIYEQYVRTDALIMEQLTSSDRIVDVYGHCAMSLIVETMEGVPIEEVIFKQTSWRRGGGLSPTEKLVMALNMSEAIAQLHGFDHGVLVHGDIQPQQFLLDRDGSVKLSDFNRGEVMLWDEHFKEYCRYKNGRVYGHLRAPEENAVEALNEKLDVYSFGNVLYTLLAGKEPYDKYDDDGIVQRMVAEGKAPSYKAKRWGRKSYAEGAMAEVMEKCYVRNPDERIDIFEVVALLRAALEESDRVDG